MDSSLENEVDDAIIHETTSTTSTNEVNDSDWLSLRIALNNSSFFEVSSGF